MLRIVLYRDDDGSGEWQEGIFHCFTDHYVVVETKDAELRLVPIKADCLKFKIPTPQWVQMQIQAQQEAKARAVSAGPIPK